MDNFDFLIGPVTGIIFMCIFYYDERALRKTFEQINKNKSEDLRWWSEYAASLRQKLNNKNK